MPAAGLRRALARHRGDLLALAFLLFLVLCYLGPAWKDGPSFGPADLGRGLSQLTNLAQPLPNHNIVNGDQITQDIPWNTLDWRLVHAGELPLWNGFSGTGLPQLLNFESAVFALPSLVSYLFPLTLAFLVTVAIKLLLAGTGAYLLCRLLGCRPAPAALGGTTAMLSGSFAGWLGWAVTGPPAWAGWVCAALLLCYRSRGRAREVALLAVCVAFAVYGGFPESYVLMAGVLLALAVVTAAALLLGRRPLSLAGLARAGAGCLAGLALSAPLWLPGISVLKASARNGKAAAGGLPLHAAVLLLAQGYDGLPIRGSYWFGPSNYYETAGYLGVVAIALVVVAVVACWRRPVVAGLVVALLACLAVIYDLGSGAPLQHLVVDLGLGSVAVQRALPLAGFLVAVLAALGAEALGARWRERQVHLALLCGSLLVLVALALLWVKVGGAAMPAADAGQYGGQQPSPATLQALRRDSLLWPTAEALALTALGAAALAWRSRPTAARAAALGRLGVAGLCGLQAAFLLFAGVGINSYASVSYPVTPQLATLQRIVGTGLLGIDAGNDSCDQPGAAPPPGCGVRRWEGFGLYPEMNLPYQLDELAMHDPVIPQTYFDAWPVPDADQRFDGNLNVFVPSVDTLALARRYGVTYVLAAPGRPAPAGMTLVARLAPGQYGRATVPPARAMSLYSVPGSSRFSFAGHPAGDRVLSARHPGDASYDLAVEARRSATLLVRITDVPGWRVSAGGHPLSLRSHQGMLEVAVPAGTTSIVLHYWPGRLSEGFALALLALLALAAWGALPAARGAWSRRAGRPGTGAGPPRRAGEGDEGRGGSGGVPGAPASDPLVPSGGG